MQTRAAQVRERIEPRTAHGPAQRKVAMTDAFENRVKAGAAAGWYVVAVAAGFVTLAWLLYLGLMSARPAWVLSLWGPDLTWPLAQRICLAAIAALKCCVWLMAFGALWLTLWARRLRKTEGHRT